MKHVFLVVVTFLLLSSTSYAQDDAVKYAKVITEANLLKQLKIIASADMEAPMMVAI